MASDTNNVKLGVCQVFFGGVDLGYTKGGVEVEATTETHKIEVDQFGKSVINEIIMGRNVAATVPLAETTLENLVRIMPGAILQGVGGTAATGTVTFVTAPPVNGDKVTIAGTDFTFKTTPVLQTDLAIPGTIAAAATALASAITSSALPLTAAPAAGVVTITAATAGVAGNSVTLAKTAATPANITVSGAVLTGGVNGANQHVAVGHGIGTSLLATAKKLVLHPQALALSDKSEDFVIPLANTAGALSFAYKLEEERIFNVTFNGYPDLISGKLFSVGDAP